MRPRKLLTWCVALVCLTIVTAAGAQAQSGRPGQTAPAQGAPADRDLTVVNRSSRTVNELYVSPSSADQWGDDRLGDDTLDPGKSTHVRLGRTRDCEFDVQVVYDDASHEESRNFNVCRNHQVAFDGSTAVAAPKTPAGDEHTLTLTNHAARPIQQVFISPADASQWGDDRLSDESISVGDNKNIDYHGDCIADLRIVFDNRSAEERRGLNICDTPSLSIEPGWTTADTVPTGPAPAPAAPPPPPPSPAPPPIAQPSTPPVSPSGRPIPGTVEKPSAQARPMPPTLTPPAPVTPRPTPPVPPPPATVRPGTQTQVTPVRPPAAVVVVNHSGHAATELYIYPDGSADRGADRLGADVLKDGQSKTISLGGGRAITLNSGANCKFGVHVVYSGNTPDDDVKGLDLCGGQQIVLSP